MNIIKQNLHNETELSADVKVDQNRPKSSISHIAFEVHRKNTEAQQRKCNVIVTGVDDIGHTNSDVIKCAFHFLNS